MKQWMNTLLIIPILLITAKATAVSRGEFKKLNSLTCRQEENLDAEPGIPHGTPMSMLRCTFRINKTSAGYNIFISSEKGTSIAGESNEAVYQPANVVRVGIAEKCKFNADLPLTLECDAAHFPVVQSVLYTEEFLTNFEDGNSTMTRNQTAGISVFNWGNGFASTQEYEKIKDCLSPKANGQILTFVLNSNVSPQKSCKIN
jgi:hypothetical protein